MPMQPPVMATCGDPSPLTPYAHAHAHAHAHRLTDASPTSAPPGHQRPSSSGNNGEAAAIIPTTPEQHKINGDPISPTTTITSPSSVSPSIGTDDSLVLRRAKRTSRKSLKAIEAEESGQHPSSVRRRNQSRSNSTETSTVLPAGSVTPNPQVGPNNTTVPYDLFQPCGQRALEAEASTSGSYPGTVSSHTRKALKKNSAGDAADEAREEVQAERALTEIETPTSKAASPASSAGEAQILASRPKRSPAGLSQVITASQLAKSSPKGRHRSKLAHYVSANDGIDDSPEERVRDSAPVGQSSDIAAQPFRWRQTAALSGPSVAATQPRRSQRGERAHSSSHASDAFDTHEDESMTDTFRNGRRHTMHPQTIDKPRGPTPAESTLSSISASEDEDEEAGDDTPMPTDAETTKVKRARKPKRDKAQEKVYLSTGLYSPAFEVQTASDVLRQRSRRRGAASSAAADASTSSSGPKKTTLPQPIYYGHDLLVCPRDFSLPYPLVHQHEQTRARVDARRKPTRYRTIDRNRYVSRPKLKGELPLCQCRPGGNCGEDCLNRLLQFVCHPRICPCGDRCTNVSLGKRPHAECKVAWYGKRGFGLRTLQAIRKYELVDEYRGEVINLREAARRVNEHYKDDGNFYFLDYDAAAGEVLDGGLCGNVTRFANHSCNPNCYIEKWLICGTDEPGTAEFQVGLFAARDIEPGEELTYDYGWSAFGTKQVAAEAAKKIPVACHCGAPNCCGVMGGKKQASTADVSSSATPVPGSADDSTKGNSKRKRETADASKKARKQARKAAKSGTTAEGARNGVPSRPIAVATRLSACADTSPDNSMTAISDTVSQIGDSKAAEAESRRSTRERIPKKVDPVILTNLGSDIKRPRSTLEEAPRRLPLPGQRVTRGGRGVANRPIALTLKRASAYDKTRKRTGSPKTITLPNALTPADAERMMARALQGSLLQQQADTSLGSWLDLSEGEEGDQEEEEGCDEKANQEGFEEGDEEVSDISEEESVDESDEDYQEAEDENVEDGEDDFVVEGRKRSFRGRISDRSRGRSGFSRSHAATSTESETSTAVVSHPPNTPLFFGDGRRVPADRTDLASWHRRVYSAEELQKKKDEQKQKNAEGARRRRQARRVQEAMKVAAAITNGTGPAKVKAVHRKALAEVVDNGSGEGGGGQGTNLHGRQLKRRLPLPSSTQRSRKLRLTVNNHGRPETQKTPGATTTSTSTNSTMSWSASSARSAVYNTRRRSTKKPTGAARNTPRLLHAELDPRYTNKHGKPKSGINSKNGIKQYVIKGEDFEKHPGVLPAIAAAAAAAKKALLASDGRLLREIPESVTDAPPASTKRAASVGTDMEHTPQPEASGSKKKMVYASTIGLPAGITDPSGAYIPDLPSNLVDSGVMSKGDARRARNAFLARVRRFIKRGYSYEVALQKASFMRSKGDESTPLFRAKLAAEGGTETTPSPAPKRSTASRTRLNGKAKAVEE